MMDVMTENGKDAVLGVLGRIEQKLDRLLSEKADRPWYTTAEVAERYGKKLYTVREWCRLGRLNAEKLSHGRGSEGEWRLSREELARYEREGLLPLKHLR